MNWDRYLDWYEKIVYRINYTDNEYINANIDAYLDKYISDLDEYRSIESIASHINEWIEFEFEGEK